MRPIRIVASVTVVLIALYFALRSAAAGCSGAGCDAYIPFSLLLPLLILVSVAVTGVVAAAHARPGSRWFATLLSATVAGVVGPVIALVVFRDSPDRFVPIATALELVVVLAALAYSVRAKGGAA